MRTVVFLGAAAVIAGVISAILAISGSLSTLRDPWFAPGFLLSDAVAYVRAPRGETQEGVYAAIGVAASWLFWTMAFWAFATVIGKIRRNDQAAS